MSARARRVAGVAVGLVFGAPPGITHAQLAACARIDDPMARLACYDELARAAAPESSPAPQTPAPVARASAPPAPAATYLERRWELRPDLKRGVFNLLPYKPVYALLERTSSPNDEPSSPTRPFDPGQQILLDRTEGKIQLSFKTKAAEGLFGTPGDLWLAYTQASYWQFANSKRSSPFRETNYEPEATYLYPLDLGTGGLRMRFIGLTLNHQSNGRGGSLSRSWNRIIGEAAGEYGSWSFHVRPWARVFAAGASGNDNPDVADFNGRGEFVVSHRRNGRVVTFAARHSLRSGERSRGSAQLDWAFPIAGALNAHVQVFSGYGLNLIDYNHRQTTLGIGVSFLD